MNQLKNTFVLLRHGESVANATGVIVSAAKNGVGGYGLTEKGKGQAVAAGQTLAAALSTSPTHPNTTSTSTSSTTGGGGELIFVTSDFARAAETAALVAAGVGKEGQVQVDIRLRERFFGELELGPDTRYQDVWAFDAASADHTNFGVEPVNAVRSRAAALVMELDLAHTGATIVCVSVMQYLPADIYPQNTHTHTHTLAHNHTLHTRLPPVTLSNSHPLVWVCCTCCRDSHSLTHPPLPPPTPPHSHTLLTAHRLSAHGDTLQILQTAFLDLPATTHRSVKHLNNCELRWM
jgi:probable phosphoglycerate mutase